MSRLLYLAHDLDDAAVWRRADMLQMGGARVTVAGFRRRSGALPGPALVLGQTYNARMLQRAVSVLKQRVQLRSAFSGMQKPDAILCRNLEMLALAVQLRRMWGAGDPIPLVYEVLDIHRLMVGPSAQARALRWIERRLCRDVDRIIVSSPAFQRAYFDAAQHCAVPILLVENKVVAADVAVDPYTQHTPAPVPGPLRIGWFGILRCSFSLHSFDSLTRAEPGKYEVVLRGRPALDELPDFHKIVENNPDMVFYGPYTYPDDLADIYGAVDLAWLVDQYDTGQNSTWLLPNRLYESGLTRVPPIALAGTETAHRLIDLGIGLTLDKADPATVARVLRRVTPASLDCLQRAQMAVPADVWRATRKDACDLVDAIVAGYSHQLPATHDASQDAVLIVVPALNEAAHIAGVIDGLTGFLDRRNALSAPARLVIADGGSTDGTQGIVEHRMQALPRFDIRLMNNPAHLQSAGVNAACARFGDGMDWLIRMDAHSSYPEDFADVLLTEAGRTGAASVVVPMTAVGESPMQRAIALTQNSRLGNGGSAHRTGGAGRFVDHGHHALMRLDAFRAAGGYDETFSHNEDAELDMRLTQAGYRIWLTGQTRLDYFPRSSVRTLFRQYVNFGGGRARTVLKHRQRPRLRQMAMISVAPMLGLTVLTPLSVLFALPATIWVLACLAAAASLAFVRRDITALSAGPIAAVMHLGWSFGFWQHVLLHCPGAKTGRLPKMESEKSEIVVDRIAVGVCTYRRSSLLDTLQTLEHQTLPADTDLTIIVIDNDDSPSARAVVDGFAADSRHEVIYRFAPSGNISIARNAALDEADRRGLRIFAFIDDDELAPQNWLAALVASLSETQADAVVGPVRALYAPDAPGWMQDLRIHDTNPELAVDGRPIAGHSCNVVMNLDSAALAGRRFDLNRGVSGGEDTAFFKNALQDGAELAFAPEASLDEPVTPARATMAWLFKRRFRMGQTHGSLVRQHNRIGAYLMVLPLALAKVLYCMVFALLTAPFVARRNAYLLRGALHLGTIAALIGIRAVAVYGAPGRKRRTPST